MTHFPNKIFTGFRDKDMDVSFGGRTFFFFKFLMRTIFNVFIEFVTILLVLHVLVFWPRDVWDLSSPNRDRTHNPCIRRWILTTRPPGKSLGGPFCLPCGQRCKNVAIFLRGEGVTCLSSMFLTICINMLDPWIFMGVYLPPSGHVLATSCFPSSRGMGCWPREARVGDVLTASMTVFLILLPFQTLLWATRLAPAAHIFPLLCRTALCPIVGSLSGSSLPERPVQSHWLPGGQVSGSIHPPETPARPEGGKSPAQMHHGN